MDNAYHKNLIYVIAVIAATGGLLFGFDTGVISGAIPFRSRSIVVGICSEYQSPYFFPSVLKIKRL